MPRAQELWSRFEKQAQGPHRRATRQFTGRTDLRQVYYQKVARAVEEGFSGYYVLYFHGIGGMGKSSLLRRLEQELFSENIPEDEVREAWQAARKAIGKKKAVVLRADMDNAALTTSDAVLRLFRAQLLEQTDAVFPLFDLAMHMLAQKEGLQLAPDKEKELLLDNPVLSFALDAIADLTGAGLVLGAARMMAQVGKGLYQKLSNKKKVIQSTFKQIELMDSAELRRRLPCYFAMDVNAQDLPLILIYLDTYEKAHSQGEGAGYRSGFDKAWLSGPDGLITNLGNAVFTIAGREALKLDAPARAEPGYLEELSLEDLKELKNLSEKDSVRFFESCKIPAELSGELYKLTQGNPLFMDLCVDEYELLRHQGKDPVIAGFSSDREQLVERYTRYVPSNLHQALYLLATLGRWTEALYDALSRAFRELPAKGGEEYHSLMRLSYIQEDAEGYFMQRSVAEILIRKLSTEYRQKLVQTLLDFMRKEGLSPEEKQGAAAPLLRPEPRLDLRASLLAMETQGDLFAEQDNFSQARRWYAMAIDLWRNTLEEHPDVLTQAEEGDLLDGWLRLPFEQSAREAWVLEHLAQTVKEDLRQQEGVAQGRFPPALWRFLVAYGRWPEDTPEVKRPEPDLDLPSPEAYQWTGEEAEGTLDAIWGWMQLEGTPEQRLAFSKRLSAEYARCLGADHFKTVQAESQYIHYALNSMYRPDLDLLGEQTTGPTRVEQVPSKSCLENADEIIQACKELVEKHRRIRTADPRQVAADYENLAKAYSYNIEHKKAADAQRKAYEIYSKVYGNNPRKDLLRSMYMLVEYSVHAGDLPAAARLQERRLCMAGDDKSTLDTALKTAIQIYQLLFEQAAAEADEGNMKASLTRLTELVEAYGQKYGAPLYFETFGGRVFQACLEGPRNQWEESAQFACAMARILAERTGEATFDMCKALLPYEDASDWRGLLSCLCLGIHYREDSNDVDLEEAERYLETALALAEEIPLPFPDRDLVEQELEKT